VPLAYGGLENVLYTLGFWNLAQLYLCGELCAGAAVIFATLGKMHRRLGLMPAASSRRFQIHNFHSSALGGASLRSSFHGACLLGSSSLGWAGHLLVGSRELSFGGGFKSKTGSFWLPDIAHHHAALGLLALWGAQLGRSLPKAAGSLSAASAFSGLRFGEAPHLRSLGLQLAAALAGLHLMPGLASQQLYALSPYLFLAYEHGASVALFLHHAWIASVGMMGSFAHTAIFLIRDSKPCGSGRLLHFSGRQALLPGILADSTSAVSTLSWVSFWLGFHAGGLWLHNDTVLACGRPQHQLLVEPVFAQLLQEASGKSEHGLSMMRAGHENLLAPCLAPLGPGDFLAHHAMALGLHVTVLILLKAALDARGSRLMRDKLHHLYAFACEGPGRGGTCDTSAWDSFYLASFWMLNLNAWMSFYFHWKHLALWENAPAQFLEASSYLLGWFRDYLWLNSAALVNAYSSTQLSDVAVYEFLFLAAHLSWATGFMFLISWRGYWQEFIDSLLWLHLKTGFVYDLWKGALPPAALSIVQARLAGLAHFATGFVLTYAAFTVGATS
jgi:photosystem I P700 chlorophyll a apoprotein A2